MLPSSLPLSVRTVEWLRMNHFNWLVDGAEHVYYTWKAPKKGGPQLTTLPAIGVGATDRRSKEHDHASPWPPRIKPVFANVLAGEGVWKPTGPALGGRPPVLVTTFRTERAYPRIVAYVAWLDHTRTALAYYPGRYEPPSATLRGPAEVPHGQRWRLLATFNSGFIYQDGLNGDALNGHANEPLRQGLATLVAYKDGRVNVVSWNGGQAPGQALAWARQSLPLIINHGRLSPKLNDSTPGATHSATRYASGAPVSASTATGTSSTPRPTTRPSQPWPGSCSGPAQCARWSSTSTPSGRP